MEPDVVTEVWVVVKLRVPAVSSALPFHIPAKDVDNAVLDLLRHLNKVHIIPAAGRALDLRYLSEASCETRLLTTHLDFVSVELVETLETFDEDEVHGKP